MYKALRKGGSMVFNVGSVGIDIEDMNKKLSQFLRENLRVLINVFTEHFILILGSLDGRLIKEKYRLMRIFIIKKKVD